jgi:hypothetical protein
MRTSANAGASYDSGASDYNFHSISGVGGSVTAANSGGVSGIDLCAGVIGNDTNELGLTGTVQIVRPSVASYTEVKVSSVAVSTAAALEQSFIYGRRDSAAAVNAIRFYFSSGNIASGIFTLYGVRRT